jgi:predicted Zn-dependent protease
MYSRRRQTEGYHPRAHARSRGDFKWLPLLLFGAFALFYWVSHQERVPLTGRRQIVDINPTQEAALGLQSYRQVLAQERVVPAGPAVDMVREIGRRLAAVSEDPGFEWEFNLIDSPQANAFCLPGGKVAVYTGILPITANADGLAVVMGHEIAHAIARHGAERMAHQRLVQLGTLATGVAVSDMDPQMRQMVLGAMGVGAQFGVLLPFSREHESEADYMGLVYAARACFNPEEAPKVWVRMGESSRGQPAEFMSTHPSHETRIRQLEGWMPQALDARAERCGT